MFVSNNNCGPLAGVRVIEVCHMLAGPYCGMLLADLGADVIKIETGEGDVARRVGVDFVDGHNLYFASLNRNKQSILLDLTAEKDLIVFRELVAASDALITNLRPAAIKKLGLTYAALSQINPRITCLSITGFGLEGPYSDNPAYDYIIQAMTGVMMLTGEPDAPPSRVGYSVVDNTGGMMAAFGLVAKLVGGGGGQVDIALFDVMLSQLNYLASSYLNTGREPNRYPSGGHPFFVPAQIFETAGGHLALFITHDNFWRNFAIELGRSDWLSDDRFATMHARNVNRKIIVAEVAEELKKATSEEWVARLQPLGVVVAAVGTLPAAMRHESTMARGMITEVNTADGPLRLIGNPIKLEGVSEDHRPPPRLGEHDALYRQPRRAEKSER